MARRVRTETPDGKPRDVWPLPWPLHGYVFNRGGMATLRYDDVYRSLGILFESKAKARAIRMAVPIAESIRAQRRGAAPPEVRTVYGAWAEFRRAKLVDASPVKRREAARALERWCPVDVPLTDDELYTVTREGVGRVLSEVSRGTFPTMLRPWRDFLAYVRARGWLQTDPLGLVSLPKPAPRAKVIVYSVGQLQRIDSYFAKLDAAPAPLLRLLWRFLALTGCRIHEALALRWSDITSTEIAFEVTKASRPRSFPLAPFPELRKLLGELRRMPHDRPGYLFPWRRKQTPAGYLVEALRELKIDGGQQPQHTFRKTAEQLWRDAGIPLEVRLRLAGHTMAVYADHYDARAEAEELARAISATRPAPKRVARNGARNGASKKPPPATPKRTKARDSSKKK